MISMLLTNYVLRSSKFSPFIHRAEVLQVPAARERGFLPGQHEVHGAGGGDRHAARVPELGQHHHVSH